MPDLAALFPPRPTRRSAMAVLFLAFLLWAAYQTEVGWLYVLAALDLALLGLSAALASRGLAGIRVQWGHRETLFEGEALTFAITVRGGRRPLQSPLELELSARRGRSSYRQGIVIWELTTGDAIHPEPNLRLPRFGRYAIPAPRVAVTDPLGLFRCVRRVGHAGTALVYPAVDASTPHLQTAVGLAVLGSSLHRTPEASLFTATRPYAAGDPRHRIHWRSLARFSHLAVKQFEDSTHNGLLLLLDNTKGTAAGLDEMIRFAAALVWAARGQRDVLLTLPGVSLAPAPSGAPWPLLATLAEVEESLLPAARIATWLEDARRARPEARQVLLLPSPTADRLAAVERLRSRELTVVVPRLDGVWPDPNRLVRWVILAPARSPAAA